MARLEVEDLSVRYGHVEALRGVTLVAEPGIVTAVLGANGAGKTTLLRAVSGLVAPSSGRILLDGDDISGLPPDAVARRGIAHVPEGRGVVQQLSVEENLRLGGMWRPKPERREAEARVCALFPVLAERRGQQAATLSGGERQALVLARALMAAPRVLLLDEPSLGLAPIVTAQLMGELASLTSEEGITVVLVEQNARTALSVAARAVVLNLGRVVVAEAADVLAADADLRHHYLGF